MKKALLLVSVVAVISAVCRPADVLATELSAESIPADPVTPGGSEGDDSEVLIVTIPSDEAGDSTEYTESFTSGNSCASEIIRFANISIDATFIGALDGSHPIRLVDVCSTSSLSEDVSTQSLVQYGNVIGLQSAIAGNQLLTSILAVRRYRPSDVVAIVPGKGATYLIVHSN